MARNKKEETNSELENNLAELNKKLNRTIKDVMGNTTSSTIAKALGKSVSTITRIRNGEIKRGIDSDFLVDIWKVCKGTNVIDLEDLLDLNRRVSDAYMKKENEKWDQDTEEIRDLEKRLPDMMSNTDVYLKKIKKPFTIIPEVELYPDLSYDIVFEDGKKQTILFYTRFYSLRRIELKEQRKKENPEWSRVYPSFFKTILEFRELRTLHKEHENCELVIIFNYEDEYKANCDILKQLSNKDNITLALLDSSTKRIISECPLDGREKGILSILGLVKEKRDAE